jgi:hypothetical protein
VDYPEWQSELWIYLGFAQDAYHLFFDPISRYGIKVAEERLETSGFTLEGSSREPGREISNWKRKSGFILIIRMVIWAYELE